MSFPKIHCNFTMYMLFVALVFVSAFQMKPSYAEGSQTKDVKAKIVQDKTLEEPVKNNETIDKNVKKSSKVTETKVDELNEVEQVNKKPKKKSRDKFIETNENIEAPAPDVSVHEPSYADMLNNIQEKELFLERQLSLITTELKILETNKKIEEIQYGPVLLPSEIQQQAEAEKNVASTIFPIPGGNPIVTSIIGGSKKAFEATLTFPGGASFDVMKGSILDNGYSVASISSHGVTLQKNGLQYTVILTSNKNSKPWTIDNSMEMGSPIE